MRFPTVRLFLAFAALFLSFAAWAQEQSKEEIEIHKNVTLIELPPAPGTPADLIKTYREFLPMLIESLKENTADQSDNCALTLRVNAGFKEIGAAKIKRPTADITAFRKNDKVEYSGRFILYSYISSGPVSKEETSQFLKKQILEPAECRKE